MTVFLKKRFIATLHTNAFVIFTLMWLIFSLNHSNASEIQKQQVPLRIAVASNFALVLKQLLAEFPDKDKIELQIISAATGTLYQQIKHGAPFDIFFAADSLHPEKLAQEQLIITDSRKTYTYGQLALWSATQQINDLNILKNLSGYLAIANPNVAPYGKAAKQVLEHLSLWSSLKDKLVTGININQTFQQVHSKAVPIGIVALSQLKINKLHGFIIPSNYYQPIAQQLVILSTSKQVGNAEKVSNYLLKKQSQNRLQALGYLPLVDKSVDSNDQSLHIQNLYRQNLHNSLNHENKVVH